MNCLALWIVAGVVVAADKPAPLEKSWYSPHELLPILAARDDIRWAMPEMLAGPGLGRRRRLAQGGPRRRVQAVGPRLDRGERRRWSSTAPMTRRCGAGPRRLSAAVAMRSPPRGSWAGSAMRGRCPR